MSFGEPHGRPSTAQQTFLFTDIESSTRAWERRPDAMSVALARHDELLHLAVKTAGGAVFKHTGDGICAAFPTAPEALAAAVAAQVSLQGADWPETGALRVRMALHSGVAERRGGDFFGSVLNRTARLLDTAHGGQVLLSLVTAELVREELPPGVELVDLGEHRLADLSRSERVFQVTHPDLPASFAPLRALGSHLHNLPMAPNAFIGRESELETVADLVRSSRLVTLVGVGGVGKTRLSLQVAAGLLDGYPDGVFLVELAPLADPALVVGQVGRALGFSEVHTGPSPDALLDGLCTHLRSRALLVVLDNCEHLIDSAAALADGLLRRCSDVDVLATSREPLGVGGEVVWRVPSLALPPPDAAVPESLAGADAVTFFCERARAADARFRLTPDNAPAVARVCRRLDGIPLALELAAARLRVLTAEQIADRLDDRFRLLSAGPRTASARQQTLRATMDWSYDLLSEPERILLQRLSVFAGNFSLAAAEAVGAEGSSVVAADVLDLLARLVDKSLVVVEDRGGEARYRLLETVRQYGRQRLVEAGAEEAALRRHRDYFLGVSDGYFAGDPFSEGSWLRRFDLNYDNLRSALEWSLAQGDADAVLRLVGMLSTYWVLTGHFVEGRARLEQALAEGPPEPTPARVLAMNGLGFLLAHQGEFDRSTALHREALTLAREVGSPKQAGVSGFFLGARMLHRGDLEDGEYVLLAAQDDFRAHGSGDGAGWCDLMLGWISFARGNPAKAGAHFRAALGPARRGAGENLLAHALGALASLEALAGDGDRAESFAEESVEAARRLGLQTILVMALTRAAEVAILLRRWDRAETTLRELMGLLRNTGGRAFLADALEMTAMMQETRGRFAPAARLLGSSEAVREASNEQADVRSISGELDGCRSRAAAVLGEAGFTAEWTAGKQLAAPEAVSFALSELHRECRPANPPVPPLRPVAAAVTGTLRPIGKHWVIGYRDASFDMPDTKGLRYLARLLVEPGVEVHVLDLVAGDTAGPGGVASPHLADAGPVLDDKAKAAYRRRVRDLQEEIDEAQAWNDAERAARGQIELEALTRQLAAAVGLGGRDRPAASAAERARVSVRKAIAAAIARIAEHDADLGLLLSTTVKTGTYCSYTPDPRLPVTWGL